MRQKRVWICFAVLAGLFSALVLLPVTWAAPDQNALRQSVPTLTPIGGVPTLPPLPTDLPTELPTVIIPTVVVPTVDLPATVTLPPILATATTPAQPARTPTPSVTPIATPLAPSSTPTITPTNTLPPTSVPTEAKTVDISPTQTATSTPVENAETPEGVSPLLLGGGGLLLMGLGAGLFTLARRRGGAVPK
ncbi:MAG: hypothetical protein RBT75_03445 [Anaerolineae bacterium]|jgi:hypothetical protein|nr:hypothetical protein [Anaerolineae bacterium]